VMPEEGAVTYEGSCSALRWPVEGIVAHHPPEGAFCLSAGVESDGAIHSRQLRTS